MEHKIKIKSRYVKLSLSIFAAGIGLLMCFYLLYNTGNVKGFFGKINDILTPFYIGIIMAYLLCPVYNGTLRCVYSRNRGRFKTYVRDYRVSRLVASLVSFLVLLLCLFGFVMLVIPALVDSVTGLVGQIPDVAEKAVEWVRTHVVENSELAELIEGKLEADSQKLFEWGQNKLLPGAEALVTRVSAGIVGTLSIILDIFIALVICIYILNSKEIFQAQAKKFILAVCSRERSDRIFEFGHICNETFGGFINGKIIDSIIIGIICFIAMSLLRLPEAVLISVVVGITNVIPFFGPFIGAIPSILLLLLIEPWAAFKFAILIFVLQQVDGNIIGPKILGKSTNLASFWVMFAILVGGGLFGFAGMILGVPTMAVIYIYASRAVNNRLNSKHMAVQTEVYEDFTKYRIDKEDIFGEEACVSIDGAEKGAPGEKSRD